MGPTAATSRPLSASATSQANQSSIRLCSARTPTKSLNVCAGPVLLRLASRLLDGKDELAHRRPIDQSPKSPAGFGERKGLRHWRVHPAQLIHAAKISKSSLVDVEFLLAVEA